MVGCVWYKSIRLEINVAAHTTRIGSMKMSIMEKFDDLIAWESGNLSEEKTIELFQFLVDTGDCWKLQGFYGRTAEYYLQCGLVFERDGDGSFIKPDHPHYRYKEYVNMEDFFDSLPDEYYDEDDDDSESEDESEDSVDEHGDTYEMKSTDRPFEKIVGEGDE